MIGRGGEQSRDMLSGMLKGVVLAGGSGTRLFPLTLVTNKHLLPVYDRPMIYYPLHTLKEMGVEEAMVVVGGRSVGDILELLHDGSDIGLELTYRYQRGARGIAHAIGLTQRFAGDDPIAIVLGDNVIRGSLRAFADEFLASDAQAGAVLKQVPDPERFGVAEFDADGRVVHFEEKPAHPKSDLIPIGVYLFRPAVFAALRTLRPSARGEFEITDLLNFFLARDQLISHTLSGSWMDAGTIESLLRSTSFAATFSAELPPVSPDGIDAAEDGAPAPGEASS